MMTYPGFNKSAAFLVISEHSFCIPDNLAFCRSNGRIDLTDLKFSEANSLVEWKKDQLISPIDLLLDATCSRANQNQP